jgi:hypothetical protein
MEVVPWTENVEFQRAIKLYEEKPNPYGGPPVSPYAQKRILNINGEFLAEADRVARSMLNGYYRANMCRSYIDNTYKEPSAGGGGGNAAPARKLMDKYADEKVVNHKSGAMMPLKDLDQKLTQQFLDDSFDRYRTYLFGPGGTLAASSGGTTTPETTTGQTTTQQTTTGRAIDEGQIACVRELLRKDLTIVQYRDIPICVDIEKRFGEINNSQDVDEYCMPSLENEQTLAAQTGSAIAREQGK